MTGAGLAINNNEGYDTDWLDEISQSAPMQRHNLSVSGGGEKTTYMVAGSYLYQEGAIGGSNAGFERYTFRVNTKSDVKSWLEVGNNLNFSHSSRNMLPEDDEYRSVVNSALLMDPFTPVFEKGVTPAIQDELDKGTIFLKNKKGQYYALNRRLNFSFDYYKKVTHGLLTTDSPVLSTGYYLAPSINGGTVENKDQVVAEAKFFRAYAYFELVTMFGAVPYYTENPTSKAEESKPRTPAATVYAAIETDLEEAIAKLPLKSQLPEGQKFRIAKGTAESNFIIILMGPRGGAFAKVENFGLNAGWGANVPTGKIGDLLYADDGVARRQASVISEDDFIDGGGEVDRSVADFHWANYENYIRLKFSTYASETGAPVPEVNYSTPFKIIRYADVLLMAAEAYNKDNQDSKAVALIKQVRERAGATDHSSWENLTGTDLFNVIVKERQLELAFEGHRFWDLVRWGLADQEIPGFVKGKHELFPIPLTEINLNSAIDLSDQNPGY